MTEPRTEAGRTLMDRLAPERDPWRCPLPDSNGEHATYGGICHCGWSRNDPERPGQAAAPDLVALSGSLAAIEAEARADALREAADRVRALRGHDQLPGYDNTEQRWVDRAAVLAILAPEPQP